MPIYQYKCRHCAHTEDSKIHESLIWSCPICREDETLPYPERLKPLHRVFTAPNLPRVWHGHTDMTSGEYVTSRRGMYDSWKRKSEDQFNRLGIDSQIIEVDPSDRASIGVTEEGLDSTHDRHVELGWKESKGKFVY